ncbi:MAG TPA: hypothetical protein VNC41_00790 [Acidimicrobiia bacterium]|jgi:hypothetical protein|nr:hypothetical protein [Acidimicrobiia bacterium]
MTTMTNEETVLRVACLTEDRAPDEQRAMLAVALRLDLDFGAFVTGNRELRHPCLVALVEDTYQPTGARVTLTSAQREQYGRLAERWEKCDECGWPRGMHPADGHPSESAVLSSGLSRRWAHVETIDEIMARYRHPSTGQASLL